MTIMDKETIDNNKKKSKVKAKKRKHTMFYKLLSFILIITSVFTLGMTIYEEIFSIKYLFLIGVVSFLVVLVCSYLLNKSNLRAWIKNIFSFFSILIIIIEALFLMFGTKTLKFLEGMIDTGYRVETFGIYVLNDSNYKKIDDLNKADISYLDMDDKNTKTALNKLKKKITIIDDGEESLEELLKTLVNKDADAIMFSSSYEAIIKDEFNDYYNKLRMIYSIDVVDMIETLEGDKDVIKETFTVYISGIDTSGTIATKARSDVNILLTINPKTNNILMVNTPRDSYVSLHSKKSLDKLTHAGIYGVEESVATLEDLYNIKIDYYARVNFTSVVKLVETLGGVVVDVPISFCEQNSKRSFDSKDLICLNKGSQKLNGEQALALARHRHTIGDAKRGENQMIVLQALMNKMMSKEIIKKYSSIIDSLSGNVTTNMSVNDMYKFAKHQLKSGDSWKFNSIGLEGNNTSGTCYSTGSAKLSIVKPKEESISKIKKALTNITNNLDNIIEVSNES